ncbi:M81 family metallopeptidase [Ottowia sp.]|uniref:M81 family metallopeptidase n=1 Tax=Ottowia sp. TaxID=1898956 RepID=UPI0039E2DAD1
MRIAVAGFHIESVSFLPVASTLADFEQVALRGEAILTALRGTNTVIGGFIDVCEQSQAQILPLVHASLGAVGPATDEAVAFYAREIADGVRTAGPALDGVLLFLHGACWAPSYPDPERFILAEVRAALGPDKPLMVALDYHGNLDADTLEHTTAAFAYRKSPHTDTGETGRRAALCMVRTLRGEIAPTWAIAKPNVLVPSIFSATALHPLADIIEEGHRIEETRESYTDISVMAGFSFADAHNTGFSVLCVTDADPVGAQAICDQLSAHIWAERRALYQPLPVYQVDAAIDLVLEQLRHAPAAGRPYVLLEHADRMNDSTYLLAALLARGVQRVAVPYLWDSVAARQAFEAGAGQSVRLRLGGHSSAKAGPTLDVTARVLWAGHKQYRVSGAYMRGMPVDLGMSAVLDIEGIFVSVVSAFAFAVDGDAFTQFGLRPEDFDIIVLRSKTHFRAFYEPLAADILIVDTPDYGVADLTQLPYRHVDTARCFPFNDHPSTSNPSTAS